MGGAFASLVAQIANFTFNKYLEYNLNKNGLVKCLNIQFSLTSVSPKIRQLGIEEQANNIFLQYQCLVPAVLQMDN